MTIRPIPVATSTTALKKLLRDIKGGRIDVVVVYKIDRLTRSLADFAKLVETFDARAISFVAVTQQFNTTTSMGRTSPTSSRTRIYLGDMHHGGKWFKGEHEAIVESHTFQRCRQVQRRDEQNQILRKWRTAEGQAV
jgi:hypothetical protein